MRLSTLAMSVALVGLVLGASALAQVRQPASATHVAYEYGEYYAQPADAPAASDKAPPAAAAPATNGGSCGCEASCDTGCDDCCDDCGCGFGGWLGDFLPCNPCRCTEAWNLFSQDHCSGWKIYGWVDMGATTNPFNPVNPPSGNGNLPVTFNYRNDEFMLNQFYGIAEKTTDGACGWDFGGRVDLLYGEDYFFTEAVGLERHIDGTEHWNSNDGTGINGTSRNGIAMPQAYVEAAYGDTKLKLGHFYTIIGYEVVPATGNFFYSHAYTMQYGEPFTHTGILASVASSDQVTWYAGVVNGWDKFNAIDDEAAFLGGITVKSSDENTTLAFAIISGDEDGTFPPTLGNRTMYSIVLTRNMSDKWQYVFQHDLGNQENGVSGTEDAQWYGINQYLFYTINDCWKAGVRAEWFDDEDGTRVIIGGVNPAGQPADWYELALGLNYKPNANIIVRPEARWDWVRSPNAGGGQGGPFDFEGGTTGRTTQFLAACDVIITW